MDHGLQQFLPFGRIIDLGEFLRQIQVIPADDAILDEPFASFGHLLVLPSPPVGIHVDCRNAAGFNSQGFGVRLTGPGAHCRDVLQLRPCERDTETQS